jgi:hypothetical protein
MTNKKIIIAMVFFVLISLFLLFLFFQNKKNIYTCTEFNGYSKISCIYSVAEQNREIDFCNELESLNEINIDYQAICIKKVAIINNDEKLCNTINNQNVKSSCLTEIAKLNKDTSLCNKLEKNFKEMCFYNLAQSEKKLELCDNILNTSLKEMCQTDANPVCSLSNGMMQSDEVYECNFNYQSECLKLSGCSWSKYPNDSNLCVCCPKYSSRTTPSRCKTQND